MRVLRRAGAKAVLFTEFFSEPGPTRSGDRAFAAAVREAGNVVLGAELTTNKVLALGDNPLVRPPRVRVSFSGPPLPSGHNAVLPLASLQESAAQVAAANIQQDPDGTCRRQSLLFMLDGNPFPQMALATYLTVRGLDRVEFPSPGLLVAGGARIPVDERMGFRILWYGPDSRTFLHRSFVDLVPSGPGALSDLRGKTVIVGVSAHGPFDFYSTPYTAHKRSPLAEVPATLVSNLLQGDFLVRVPAAASTTGAFLLAALVCGLFLYGPGLAVVVPAAAAAACAWLGLAAWLFAAQDLWLDVVGPITALALAFAASAAASYQVEGKARRRLRSVFDRYVSPVVVSEILDRREQVELGGQEVIGTAFFSDLQDFTAFSERLPPREVVAFLNEYFSLTSEVILAHGGLIDKYIGDAVMALFGAPIPVADHAAQACDAVLELRRRLAAAGRPAWNTRIGIHSGPMVVGNIGTQRRLDYTAIGDTVNLASRLEGVNKLYGTTAIVSEATLRAAGAGFEARELDLLTVKGRVQALRVYELLGRTGEVSAEIRSWSQRFEGGLSLYRGRDFARALTAFEAVLAARPGDGPAETYIGRCRRFLQEPPPADWDGAHRPS